MELLVRGWNIGGVDGLEKEEDSESDLTAQLAKTLIASLDSSGIG